MNEFPQIRDITIDDYVDEIKKSIDNKNYLSALSVSLMIPDICKKVSFENLSYVEWFNKYVFKNYYNTEYVEEPINKDRSYKLHQIRLNGDVCYALRNAILHSGTSYIRFEKPHQKERAKIDRIELCINGDSPIEDQYGEAVSIVTYDKDKKTISIRVNIILLIISIVEGFEEFKTQNNDTRLFSIIDWDKKGGKIIFTPSE